MRTPELVLYTRVDCHLCDVAKSVLDEVGRKRVFALKVVDVDSEPSLVESYGQEVPVVTIDGRKAFKFRIDPTVLRAHLDRAEAAERG